MCILHWQPTSICTNHILCAQQLVWPVASVLDSGWSLRTMWLGLGDSTFVSRREIQVGCAEARQVWGPWRGAGRVLLGAFVVWVGCFTSSHVGGDLNAGMVPELRCPACASRIPVWKALLCVPLKRRCEAGS